MKKLNIPVILGTGRDGRQSEKVAKFVFDVAKEFGFETQLVDVRDHATTFTVPGWVDTPEKEPWKKIVTEADGFIFVVPEYNHGYPGEFKILLDKLFPEYSGKTVGICAVSGGGIGGARMVENLLPVLHGLDLNVLVNSVYFSNVEKLFDDQGVIQDEKYAERVQKMCEGLQNR